MVQTKLKDRQNLFVILTMKSKNFGYFLRLIKSYITPPDPSFNISLELLCGQR